jgi:protocatechuate 3,4-dioxygenase beta subunit
VRAMSTTRRSVLVQLAALGLVSACKPDTPAGDDSPPSGDSPGDSPSDSPHDSAVDTGTPWDEDFCEADAVEVPPEDCLVYPPAGEGPFYRDDIPERSYLNVWEQEGTKLIVLLRITELCVPIEGAKVELWHAGQDGVYDTESAEANGYGFQVTDLQGAVCFRTIRPPSYLSNPEDPESEKVQQHIHLKVWVDGELRANTQLQFADDPIVPPQSEGLRHDLEDVGREFWRLAEVIELSPAPA